MIISSNGKTPKIAGSAFVSEAACVIGDVEIGENSGVWPGAVIRGDMASIRIGSNTQIEDNSVVHSEVPMEIGDNVIVGHSVVVHCARVGNNTLIGNNATVLDNVRIGKFCIIGAGCLVTPGMEIPDNSFAIGSPAGITERPASRRWRIGRKGSLSYTDLVRLYKEQGL